ncbi:hypothetical protein DCCM_2696 [Desulfocucumis palustris]|uniref:Uncharacterized protein n=1 Tax=Desulfocucumis palustris TaxID=1898651 RepID=A0A2L2XBT7_9FIRM|nr:hypothetical protein DCCM_2696 [Desulfocucumis palustris]
MQNLKTTPPNDTYFALIRANIYYTIINGSISCFANAGGKINRKYCPDYTSFNNIFTLKYILLLS